MNRAHIKVNPEQNSSPYQEKKTAPFIRNRLQSDDEYQKIIDLCIPILLKNSEHRSNSDNAVLKQFTKRSSFFKKLQTVCSAEVTRSFLKFGKIVKYSEKQVILRQKDLIENIKIGLTGKYAFCHSSSSDSIQNLEILCEEQNQRVSILQDFMKFSSKYIKLLKKNPQLSSKKQKQTDKMPGLQDLQMTETIHLDGEHDRVFFSEKHFQQSNSAIKNSCSLATLSECYVFEVDLKKFNEIFRDEYNKKITKIMDQFLRFQCFNLMKREKLKQMIEDTDSIAYPKNHCLFKEGQSDDRIFFLIKGQIKLERNVSVGKQNPNQLYRNRLSIRKAGSYRKVAIPDIAFADYSKVFNVDISSKKVHLSTLSAPCIFGEEEIVSNTVRQAQATVSSSSCELYEMTLSSIGNYFTKDGFFQAIDFLKTLEQELTNKKILYRQQKLGSQINLLNRSAKSGFYLSENKATKPKSHRQILRMNKTICPSLSQPHRTLTHEKTNSNMTQIDSSRTPVNSVDKLQSQTACQGFEMFFNEKQKPQNQDKVEQGHASSRLKFNDQEKGILDLLHGNQRTLSLGKSRRSRQENHRIKKAEVDTSIDITKPLFSAQYIESQRKQEIRIQNQGRTQKIERILGSTNNRVASRVRTLNNSRAFDSTSLRQTSTAMPKRSQSFRL